MLSPPSAKKSSNRPTSEVESKSANTAASACSVSVRVGSVWPLVLTAGRGNPGRFSFPDSVLGSASSTVSDDGTMYPGRVVLIAARTAAANAALSASSAMKLLRHNVSGQAGAVVHLPGPRGSGRDTVGGGQCGLDLGQLDPESANLHLMVGAAGELQSPVLGPPGQIAAAVQPATGFGRKGVGNKTYRGQRGPLPVAAGQLVTGVVQLAHHADRHRPQAVVQQIGLRPGHR